MLQHAAFAGFGMQMSGFGMQADDADEQEQEALACSVARGTGAYGMMHVGYLSCAPCTYRPTHSKQSCVLTKPVSVANIMLIAQSFLASCHVAPSSSLLSCYGDSKIGWGLYPPKVLFVHIF